MKTLVQFEGSASLSFFINISFHSALTLLPSPGRLVYSLFCFLCECLYLYNYMHKWRCTMMMMIIINNNSNKKIIFNSRFIS